MSEPYALFEVSVKVLLRNNEQLLVLENHVGKIDFPGGRINAAEIQTEPHTILKREMTEELGNDVCITLGGCAFYSKRTYTFDHNVRHVIVLFYEGIYVRGQPALSSEHRRWRWATPSTLLLHPEQFQSEDEYQNFASYISRQPA